MDRITLNALQGAAGAGGSDPLPLYVEDVFSTYLYEGDNTLRSIQNGIDLAGEGGLVWIKNRDSGTQDHVWCDTERGAGEIIESNNSNEEFTSTARVDSFLSDGFKVGTDNATNAGASMCSWTFRKAPGFFDIVTWDGNGVDPRTINHNLGSIPGMIIVKRTDSADDWIVYHKDVTTGYLKLNEADVVWTRTDYIYQNPTNTTFRVGGFGPINATGGSYVAYLFADGDDADAQIFGDGGDESIIKCGSFTTDSSGNGSFQDLGWEPQFVIQKSIDPGTGKWYMSDNMRGMSKTGTQLLRVDDESVEGKETSEFVLLSATGFTPTENLMPASNDCIYIAIRRGPMKTPEVGTEVFNTTLGATTTTIGQRPENVDMYWFGKRAGWAYNLQVADRVRGFESTASWDTDSYTSPWMYTNGVTAEAASGGAIHQRTGVGEPFVTATSLGSNFLNYVFKRAPGFFDIVCYDGSNSVTAFNHNLGVKPELVIFKSRSHGQDWVVKFQDKDNYLYMNNNAAYTGGVNYFDAEDTATTFYASSANAMSSMNNYTYVAYLFATLAGISKVGSYTGTGSNIDVDCGFTSGARFVLVKRTDSTGDWYLWDTERGIVSGDDPYLFINDNPVEVTNTDYIDPFTTGFTVTSSAPDALNVLSGEYIYLAIA